MSTVTPEQDAAHRISGSGKTFLTQHELEFLLQRSSPAILTRVLRASNLLQAMGNAPTEKNQDSS